MLYIYINPHLPLLPATGLHHLFLHQQPQGHVKVLLRPHRLDQVREEEELPVLGNVRSCIHEGTEDLCHHAVHSGGRGFGARPADLLLGFGGESRGT